MRPLDYGWWLTSRAAGITALVCVTVAVGVGLVLGGKVARRPGWPRLLMAVHEHAALAGLVAIAVHGLALLGDAWLHPRIVDIAVPLTGSYRPVATAAGIAGGWLAALLGLTFYARRRIGPKLWRTAHRATVLVYVLAVAHTLGAGTDAQTAWMRLFLLTTGAPILFLFLVRVLPRQQARRRAAAVAGR